MPVCVCGVIMKRELEFWNIDENEMEPCCWIRYREQIESQLAIEDAIGTFMHNEDEVMGSGAQEEDINPLNMCRQVRAAMWRTLNYPTSSTLAMVGLCC